MIHKTIDKTAEETAGAASKISGKITSKISGRITSKISGKIIDTQNPNELRTGVMHKKSSKQSLKIFEDQKLNYKKEINFYKMHGLGNDFIFINKNQLNLLPKQNLSTDEIAFLSHRRLSIGCDQLIIFEHLSRTEFNDQFNEHGSKIKQEKAKNEIESRATCENIVLLKIYNQDGTEAEMCMNAVRCLSHLMKYLHDFDSLEVVINNVIVSTTFDRNTGLSKVTLGMPIQMMELNEQINLQLSSYGLKLKYSGYMNVGNPHLVLVMEDDVGIDQNMIGLELSKHKMFPKGVNVGFAKVLDQHNVQLVVYERGAGLTLSCGSGAAAAFAFLNNLGFVRNETSIKFEYGDLKFKNNQDNTISVSGPTCIAFNGTILI